MVVLSSVIGAELATVDGSPLSRLNGFEGAHDPPAHECIQMPSLTATLQANGAASGVASAPAAASNDLASADGSGLASRPILQAFPLVLATRPILPPLDPKP